MRAQKSIVGESRDINLAVNLIKLGARLQVLESETNLSYERLLKLYKEVQGKSPSKGMLPFSTDWFMSWQPNIHSSLFLNIYEYLNKSTAIDDIEKTKALGFEAVLTITRAWRLVKFVDAGMVQLTPCTCCGGKFVAHTNELTANYVCGLCNIPARAGKTRAAAQTH